MLSKFDKFVYVGCPWFFGVVLTTSGVFLPRTGDEKMYVLLLISAGLICVSLYCVCALLVKLIEKK